MTRATGDARERERAEVWRPATSRRSWVPEGSWTGDWALPEVLTRPVTLAERGALVALACSGMGPARLARSLADRSSVAEMAGEFMRDARRVLGELERLGARAVLPCDEEYPCDLAAFAAPPPLLFVRGSLLDEMVPGVAIVGARACTNGGRRFAAELGEAIAAAGFTVVSGLARGIDAAAHQGALAAGRSVAVLGTGVDVCYPLEHSRLAEGVAASGGLVTEFPPGTGPRAWHFPARNRIISGLSIAVVVVEASGRSGALITADFALDQGREVFACTTGPTNPAGAGVRAMLRDGARLLVDAEQAVEDLLDLAHDQGFEVTGHRLARTGATGAELTGDAALVYAAVTEGTTTDEVVASTGLEAGYVSALLVDLELEGHVEAEGGGRWRRSG